MKDKKQIEERVEKALREAVLWDEIYDRLDDSGLFAFRRTTTATLPGTRVLALEPEVILLDEPTSALDPVSTAKIEMFLEDAKEEYTFLLAPHNQQQAARTADFAAFFLQGKLVEYAPGEELFFNPKVKETADYIEGRFG